MDCTLKIIAGPEDGQEFTCAGPETYIGRSQRCAVRLTHASVSFEHAVIHRAGDEFFVENLSANGTLLNNQRLISKMRIKARDQIRVGDQTVLRVEHVPAVAGSGSGSSRALLVLVLVVMLFGGVAFLVVDPFGDKAAYDWQHAYATLQTMVDQETAAGKMQPGLPTDFREAWRLEVAGNRGNADKAWLGVHIAVSDYENKLGIRDISLEHRNALARLLTHDKKSSEPALDELQAALDQFVTQMQHHPKIK